MAKKVGGVVIPLDYEEIKEYIQNASESSKIYIGCDSQRIRKRRQGKKFARYVTTVVCHIDSKHGARVFGGVSYHQIMDGDLSKPFTRLFKEAEMVVETYEELYEVLIDRDVELHIDINPDKQFNSNIVHGAAKGYILGMTGIEPKVKPEAWAASCAADHYVKGGV